MPYSTNPPEENLPLSKVRRMICQEIGMDDISGKHWKKEEGHQVVSFYDSNFDLTKKYSYYDSNGEEKNAWWPIFEAAFGNEPDWDFGQKRTHNQPSLHNLKVILKAIKRVKKERLVSVEYISNLMCLLKTRGLNPVYDTITQEVKIVD